MSFNEYNDVGTSDNIASIKNIEKLGILNIRTNT
jgi:hypothetical protein